MRTSPEDLALALWAVNLSGRADSIEDWVSAVEDKANEARMYGADLLMLPEYACEQWLSFKPRGLKPDQEIAWLAGQATHACAMLAPLARRYEIALLAGTMPARAANGFRNRATLFLPDGLAIEQDKLCLTPGERDRAGWHLEPGERVRLLNWNGVRLAIAICLDIELPALAARLAPHAPDLILVPSMTAGLSGQSRVAACARARAVELMAAVAVCGTVGAAPGTTQNPSSMGGCAVYVPCEPALGFTGLHAELPPVSEDEGAGPFLIVRDVPIGQIRALRRYGAEVWPGPWDALSVEIEAL